MVRTNRGSFLRGFLERFLDNEYAHNRLTQPQYLNLQASLSSALVNRLETCLRASRGQAVPASELGGTLTLLTLREPTLRAFPFLQFRSTPQRGRASRRRLKCFVGHRFQENFERSLRINLRHLLEPYGVALVWAGEDLQAGDLFETIIKAIRACDFCIFDNLGTLNKPNVYIEAGIAYALKTPFVFCEYIGRSSRVLDTGGMPADLRGLLRVQYHSYQDMCEQLYFGLPDFFDKEGFR